FASTASAGSFCLFCENGAVGLPKVTSVSGLNAPATAVRTSAATATSGTTRRNRLISPPLSDCRELRQPHPSLKQFLRASASAAAPQTFGQGQAYAATGCRPYGQTLR